MDPASSERLVVKTPVVILFNRVQQLRPKEFIASRNWVINVEKGTSSLPTAPL